MDDSPPVERYYTYKEAAEILRVKHRTVSRLAWITKVPRWRMRRGQYVQRHVRLLPESVIRQWLKERLVKCESNISKLSALRP